MKKGIALLLTVAGVLLFLVAIPAQAGFDNKPDPDGGTWMNGIPLWADLDRINWEKTTFDHWEYITPELGDSSLPISLLYALAGGTLVSALLIHKRRKAGA